jgi:hypothetical protein
LRGGDYMATTVQPKLKKKKIPGVRIKPILSTKLHPVAAIASRNQPKIHRARY